MSALARRRLRLPIRLPRISPAVAAILAGLVIVLVAGWFWLRDSSLVAVRKVTITGVTGPDAAQISGALRASALTMTTLDVDMSRLRGSVEPYRDVVALAASTSFPHGIAIHVTEQVPLATVTAGGRTLAIAAGGIVVRASARLDGRLPQLAASLPSGGDRLTDPAARAVLRVLAAAPWPIIAHIARASDPAGRGVVLNLRSGPQLRFGTAEDLRAKWAAAEAVLADSGTAGASYIDVSDPQRPAAGASGSGAAAGTTPTSTSAASVGSTPATSTSATSTSASSTPAGSTRSGVSPTDTTAAAGAAATTATGTATSGG